MHPAACFRALVQLCDLEDHTRINNAIRADFNNSGDTLTLPAPTSLAFDELDLRKMNLQLIANEENQDRAQDGKNDAGGMISLVCRARKHVGNAAADDRSGDAEHEIGRAHV